MATVNCKVDMRSRGMAAVATVVVMMMAVAVMARPAAKLIKDDSCTSPKEYVYPFWSFCNAPAQLSTGYQYFSPRLALALAPEYDETNATYYVRLAESGASYVAVTEADTTALLVDSTVYIYNADSKRALAWRQEGTDEYFLIEQEVNSITEAAAFLFRPADSVILPCPLIYPPAQCSAYYLVSYVGGASSASGKSGAGLQSYEEDSVTYIKAAAEGSTGDLPILVLRATPSSATPFPTIRSVTARE